MHMDGKISLHFIVITLWIVFYIIIGNVSFDFISESISLDSNHLETIISDMSGFEGSRESQYYLTSIVFSYIPIHLMGVVVFVVGAISLIIFMRKLRHPIGLIIAVYITLPAIVLFLVRLQKETLFMLIAMLVLAILTKKISVYKRVIVVVGIYCMYAYFLRTYYFIIISVFLVLLVFIYAPKIIKLSLIFFAVGVMVIIPDNIFMELQGARDMVNYYRIGTGDIGSRTAFYNLVEPDNLLNFCINYIYAFLKLNLAPLFHFGAKEILLLSLVIIYLYFIYIGIGSKYTDAILCSSLLLAHLLTYMLFEPDLGSYLRHLSSGFLYLTPSIVLFENKILNGPFSR